MEFTLTPQSVGNQMAGVLAIGRDVSARRKAEHANAALQLQVQQMQKLEALGRLAGGIAHDFNNFLTIIAANAQMARMELIAGHPAVQSLDQINEASQRASAMVRQILAFARNQSQERQVLRLEPVVRDALKLLRSALPLSVHLEASLDSKAPRILANVEQIHQILLNLGTNAAHAMGERSGHLEVTLDAVSVSADAAVKTPGLRTGRYARLTMRDNGQGMDAATLERIFDPFFTTKPHGRGSGLGLAIVQNIVKNHDGTISVQSQPGQGTVFHVYFPAIAAEQTVEEPGVGEVPNGRGEHILLVDDDPSFAESAQRLMECIGYRVSVCASAEDGLKFLRTAEKRVDCLLSDLALPGMSGLELAAEWHRLQPGIPMVLMSANACVLSLESLQAFGVHDFLEKPFTLRLLAQSLERALRAARQ